MIKHLTISLAIITALVGIDANAEKIKKGVKIYVPLTVGSFEITSNRIKGGKLKEWR